ncbi:tRNA lysidine(34) synthetase TilS [Streptococcus koreensis]|jgi:tRNA(ile)-lysidine synthase|uniref:tRNA lysidine(34) synthetase TilS n=1 Tax=Streptococcus TaxID=1301 RepID=UPI0022E004F5|nr:tRNA lysidine(34) synthetase TilS [Streptococcus koreensis]
MKEKFFQFCQKEGLFESHQKVLLALSGGVDSMTLLDWLYHYQHQLGIDLVLAHVNHHQRIEADQEERGIRELAEAKHLPLKIAHFSGHFSESRARQFRYDFFEKVMKEEACSALVTAHHMDDQAETILMRLIRGSRPRHLKGIPLKQPFGQGVLIRPLLYFKKEDFPEIFHYEDKSNQSLDYFRNRVRHRYLPLLEEENPQVTSALVNLGEDLSHWHQALKELTKDLNPQDVTQFQKQSPAVQIYLLEEYIASFPDLQLSRAQFEQLHRIVVNKSNTQQVLKNGYEIYKDYHYFEIRKISRRTDDRLSEDLLQFGTIKIVGAYRFLFGVEPSDSYMEAVPLPSNHPVYVRPRRDGDRILINGHHKKVSRLLINKKIPLDQRNNLVVLEQDKQILAIPEIAISDLSKELKNDIIRDTIYIQKIDR